MMNFSLNRYFYEIIHRNLNLNYFNSKNHQNLLLINIYVYILFLLNYVHSNLKLLIQAPFLNSTFKYTPILSHLYLILLSFNLKYHLNISLYHLNNNKDILSTNIYYINLKHLYLIFYL
jgi:hypothetical protein